MLTDSRFVVISTAKLQRKNDTVVHLDCIQRLVPGREQGADIVCRKSQ